MAEQHPIYYDWKVEFNDNPDRTQGGIYSLFDLLYEERPDGQVIARYMGNGTVLEHDIICHNDTLYDSKTGYPNRAKGSFDAWVNQGIDIIPVKIDKRAILHEKTRNGKTIKYFSKDSIIKYKTVEETIEAAVNVNESEFADIWINYDEGWKLGETTKAYTGHTVSTNTSKDMLTNTSAALVLDKSDDSFDSIYNTTNIDLKAYKRLFVKSNVLVQILNYYILTAYKGLGVFNEDSVTSLDASQILSALNAEGEPVAEGGTVIPNDDTDLIFEFLKNTYVFLRLTYFADYIQPDVFKQDLTSDSEVKHKNIIVSKEGDFHRFSDDLIDQTPAKTRFYRMQTAPTEDILSKKYAKQLNIEPLYDKSQKKALYDKLYDKHGLFGSVLYDNENDRVTKSKVKVAVQDQLSTPQYFDPESTRREENNNSESDLPVLIPDAGNIYVDGRIIGPTIDEIWKYFKQIVSGTIARDQIDIEKDNGFTYNDSFGCGADTTPGERAGTIFHRDYTLDEETGLLNPNPAQLMGDPIESEIKNNGEFEYLDITKWVNPPTNFKIQVYEFLKNASAKVEEGLDPNRGVTADEGGYSIQSVTPNLLNNEFNYEVQSVGRRDPIAGTIYGPRQRPYSLRELEAMLANAKYNINALMSFLVKNYTVNGALSYGQSGLFQFHRDYNSEISNPNTLYRGVKDENDIEDRSFLNKDALENYGAGSAESSNNCRPKDVYLAADGTWRYIHQETKIRVFDTEF